jgi:hypothetical protein
VRFAKCLMSVACLVAIVQTRAYAAVEIYAQTGFNDQAGINSDPTAGSPYTIGQTVEGRGSGEAGWGSNWVTLNGGGLGGGEAAIIKTVAAFEGDAGLAVVPASAGNTTVQRKLAEARTDHFVVETRINFGSVGELQGRPMADNLPLQVNRIGPLWQLSGAVGDRHFFVWDGQSNQLGQFEDTGIAQTPGEWQNVVLDINVAAQTFTFAVDGVPYNAPDPIGFYDAAAVINSVSYLSSASGSIDSVIIRNVPEPTTASVLGALSVVLLGGRRRSRLFLFTLRSR